MTRTLTRCPSPRTRLATPGCHGLSRLLRRPAERRELRQEKRSRRSLTGDDGFENPVQAGNTTLSVASGPVLEQPTPTQQAALIAVTAGSRLKPFRRACQGHEGPALELKGKIGPRVPSGRCGAMLEYPLGFRSSMRWRRRKLSHRISRPIAIEFSALQRFPYRGAVSIEHGVPYLMVTTSSFGARRTRTARSPCRPVDTARFEVRNRRSERLGVPVAHSRRYGRVRWCAICGPRAHAKSCDR